LAETGKRRGAQNRNLPRLLPGSRCVSPQSKFGVLQNPSGGAPRARFPAA
jgi:hypothetical protein